MTCQSLQSLATYLKFDWNTPHAFRDLFNARLFDYLGKRAERVALTLGTLLGVRNVSLTVFEPDSFEDFIWRTLFVKTLPAGDFAQVVSKSMELP